MPSEAPATLEVEAFLADWLGKDAALTRLHDGHFHPVIVPDGVDLGESPEKVLMTYRRTNTQREMSFAEPVGNAKATFEIRIWGRSDMRGYLAICRAARLARMKLDGLVTETPDGHFITAARVSNEADDAEEVASEDMNVVYLCRVLTAEIEYDEMAHAAIGGA